MAIYKMSSKELMDVLDTAEQSVSNLRSSIGTIRQELDKKLKIFSNAIEFSAETAGVLGEYLMQKDRSIPSTIVLGDAEIVDGKYTKYGLNILPASAKHPNNIFNLMAATGPLFKNNATVYINGEIAPTQTGILMHEGIKDRPSCFEEYAEPDLTLRIEINPNDMLGATACNTIELLPFIPGSFNILGIRFFSMRDYRNKAETPSITMDGTITNVGASRIVLPENIDLYACELDIRLRFKNAAEKYPFGLRHLYFLNCSYREDSHVVVKLSQDAYIDWISDDITIHDQSGMHITTCSNEGIKLYASYADGIFGAEILPTKGAIQNGIARNIRTIFVDIPVKNSISSIRFAKIGTR